MNKVNVTREQADAIEKYKAEQRKLHEESKGVHDVHEWTKPLLELDSNEFMDALYIGYEVEPEFKVGDYVHHVKNNVTLLLDEEHRAEFVNNDYLEKEYIRPATPEEIAEEKERRWWSKHNRDVWELKDGDVLWDEHRGEPRNVYEIRGGIVDLLTCRLSFEEIKGNYSVICFAENRLDVKTNE